MSIHRIIAIIIIYLITCGGWVVLGTATQERSGVSDRTLHQEVIQLWGGPLVQPSPRLSFIEHRPVAEPSGVSADAFSVDDQPEAVETTPVIVEGTLAQSTIDVDLSLEHRRKGLVWFPTFTCVFAAEWTIENPTDTAIEAVISYVFPARDATYDGFALHIDDELQQRDVDTATGITETIMLEPGQQRRFAIAYTTRGLTSWTYRPAAHVGRVRNLDLTVRTDFRAVDYISGGRSPGDDQVNETGRTLTWTASDLITRQAIGIMMPDRLNPGPLTSRITFFAPVCLGFFFLLLATVNIVRRLPIHPMHYLFIGGGFFAFHLLLAYLVDHIDVHLAFVLSALVSLALTTGYLRGALGERFPTLVALGGQAFFLVLFSYSFFLEGTTGLTVALGSVVTLAVLMRVTASIDWYDFFKKPAVAQPDADGDDDTTDAEPVLF